jgi:hypothetical protein
MIPAPIFGQGIGILLCGVGTPILALRRGFRSDSRPHAGARLHFIPVLGGHVDRGQTATQNARRHARFRQARTIHDIARRNL